MQPEKTPEYSLQAIDVKALEQIILCAMNKLIDEMDDETLDPGLDINGWVSRFVQQHVWDI